MSESASTSSRPSSAEGGKKRKTEPNLPRFLSYVLDLWLKKTAGDKNTAEGGVCRREGGREGEEEKLKMRVYLRDAWEKGKRRSVKK